MAEVTALVTVVDRVACRYPEVGLTVIACSSGVANGVARGCPGERLAGVALDVLFVRSMALRPWSLGLRLAAGMRRRRAMAGAPLMLQVM